MARADRRLAIALTIVALAIAAASHAASQGGRHPMRIALIVDTSAATASVLQLLRPAVIALVDAVPADADLLLVSAGRRAQVRVPPTTDHARIKSSVQGLVADGGPTPLIDALLEIDDRFMKKAADRWPVYVIITGDGSESSRTEGDVFSNWLTTLAARHVSGHAVVIKTGNGLPESIARAVTQAAPGHFETVSGGNVEKALKSLGTLIAEEYDRAR